MKGDNAIGRTLPGPPGTCDDLMTQYSVCTIYMAPASNEKSRWVSTDEGQDIWVQ